MAAKVNPLVKIAMTGAGIGAGIVGKKILTGVWESVFKEDIPDQKRIKKANKDLKKRQKAAKKEGAAKEEIASMKGDFDDVPAWRLVLWTVLSGTIIMAFKQLAREATRRGADKLVSRRPSPNRG